MSEWKFFEPKFEYKKDFEDYDTPWAGHIFFAYDLIRNLEPKNLVELGTFKGTSFYSFSQAVKDASLKTELFAVDTWEGDPQAGLLYGDKTYHFVIDILRKYYGKQNTRLLRKTFLEASKEFKANSIDVLHIDGLHTYEAVKEDYETWKGKVKDSGVIIFHDIKVADFAVWKVWEEAKKDNKEGTFIEFEHNFGLGVIFKKGCGIQITDESLKNALIAYYKTKAENFYLKSDLEKKEALNKSLNELQENLKHNFEVLTEKALQMEKRLSRITNSKLYKIKKKVIG